MLCLGTKEDHAKEVTSEPARESVKNGRELARGTPSKGTQCPWVGREGPPAGSEVWTPSYGYEGALRGFLGTQQRMRTISGLNMAPPSPPHDLAFAFQLFRR